MTKEQILKTLDTKVSDGTITEILREIVKSTSPIVIAPKVGNTIDVDAYALGQLAKILEKNDTSIFDVILKNVALFEGDGDPNYGKVLGVRPKIHGLSALDRGNGEIFNFTIPYTSTQYEGLAAVQEAGEAQHPDEGMKDYIPKLQIQETFLMDNTLGYLVTDLEGHKISVTVADGKLASVAISEEIAPSNPIKVPFEEIQKLIGLPIAKEQEDA